MSAKNQVDDIRRAKGGCWATFVKGHKLVSEGIAHDENGRLSYRGQGRAKCSCGLLSEWLDSKRKRQAWHRQHKLDVITEATS